MPTNEQTRILTVLPTPDRIEPTRPPVQRPCHICGTEATRRRYYRSPEPPICEVCYGLEVEAVSTLTVPLDELVRRNHARAVHFGWRTLADIEARRAEIERSLRHEPRPATGGT